MNATILVVDDELPIAELVATVLEEEGHRVIRAHDGATALARIKADGFDLMITDNMMPFINGTELVGFMHDNPALATPVILMSAVRPIAPPPKAVFLPKPFDIDDLVAQVRTLLA
jgi:two-component system sensor histidine kinase/response regulator